jgi:hypothetical protein
MSGDSVRVDPMGLFDYGEAILQKVAEAQGDTTKAMTGISQNTIAAFGTFPAGGGRPFAEGISAMHLVDRNLQDLQAFLQDVTAGMQAIESAATAMAVMYATTDADQANSLNAVDFAFADGGTAPAGFPTKGVSTMFDQEMAAEAASGQNTGAALAAGDPTFLQFAATRQEVPGGWEYTFADGSRLQVVSGTSGSDFISDNTTTTSVFLPGSDQAVSITMKGTSTDYSGQQTTTTSTQTRNPDGSYSTSSQSTTVLNDGRVQVETTTTDPATGKPTTQTVTVQPHRPDPGQTGSGAIQDYENEYHSKGTQQGMQYGQN